MSWNILFTFVKWNNDYCMRSWAVGAWRGFKRLCGLPLSFCRWTSKWRPGQLQRLAQGHPATLADQAWPGPLDLLLRWQINVRHLCTSSGALDKGPMAVGQSEWDTGNKLGLFVKVTQELTCKIWFTLPWELGDVSASSVPVFPRTYIQWVYCTQSVPLVWWS